MLDPNLIQLLDKVDGFYSHAFNNLVIFTVGILGFAGLLIPLAIQYYQNRTFRASNEALERQLRDYSQKLADGINDSVAKLLAAAAAKHDDDLKLIRDEIAKKFVRVQGATLHVQAQHYRFNGNNLSAADDFASAAQCYLESDDELNLRRVLPLISECLAKLTQEDLVSEMSVELERSIRTLAKSMEERNSSGRFSDEIRRVNWSFADVSKRTRQNSPDSSSSPSR